MPSVTLKDDGRMADEMIKRSEFLEYMQAFEERINARFDGVDRRLDGVDRRLDSVDRRLDGVDRRFDLADKRSDGIDNRVAALEQSMKMQFEETRGLIRLSLEGLGALRETTEHGFADVRRKNQDNKTLLEAALKHVRRRVERVESARPVKRPT